MRFSFLLFLALFSLANAVIFFEISPGDFSNFTLSKTSSAFYEARVANLFLDGSVTTTDAIFYHNNATKIFSYSQPNFSYYFLSNGTYFSSRQGRVYIPGNGYDYIASIFNQTLQSSKFTSATVLYAIQYSGRVNVNGSGNSITLTISPDGFLLAADFDGVDSPDKTNKIIRTSYAITKILFVCENGVKLPLIPAKRF